MKHYGIRSLALSHFNADTRTIVVYRLWTKRLNYNNSNNIYILQPSDSSRKAIGQWENIKEGEEEE